jgi:hypothetical protein
MTSSTACIFANVNNRSCRWAYHALRACRLSVSCFSPLLHVCIGPSVYSISYSMALGKGWGRGEDEEGKGGDGYR